MSSVTRLAHRPRPVFLFFLFFRFLAFSSSPKTKKLGRRSRKRACGAPENKPHNRTPPLRVDPFLSPQLQATTTQQQHFGAGHRFPVTTHEKKPQRALQTQTACPRNFPSAALMLAETTGISACSSLPSAAQEKAERPFLHGVHSSPRSSSNVVKFYFVGFGMKMFGAPPAPLKSSTFAATFCIFFNV